MERDIMVQHLRRMLDMGLFIDPLLVNTIWRLTDSNVRAQVSESIDVLFSNHIDIDRMSRNLEDYPYSSFIAWYCLKDVIMTTACLVAHEESGAVYPTPTEVRQAQDRIEKFVAICGIETLYKLYYVIVGHDIIQPHLVHKNITEPEFIHGIWHHPYESPQLNLYLLVALARKIFRLKPAANGRIIQLTKFGQTRFEQLDEILKEVKYIDKRISMSYVYQFDHVHDFDELCDKVWPDTQQMLRSFVDWSAIKPLSKVLEVGCGTGALTYEAHLHEITDSGGALTAIDMSIGMLEQARRKQSKYDPDGKIQFTRASVENLPFASESFSVSIGSAFLHFTNPVKAIAEMVRVVVPGGMVSILQGLYFGLNQPFFRDWFEPIFEVAKRNNEDLPKSYLPQANQLPEWFKQAGLKQIKYEYSSANWLFDDPETAVQHIVRGVSFFQHELMTLPWNDRKTIVNDLIDRGRDVCRRYPLSERTIVVPSIMIKGWRPLTNPASITSAPM